MQVLASKTEFDGQYGQDAEFDADNSGTAKTIDFDKGNVQKIAITGACTFTLSNPRACTRYMLKLVQGSGGQAYTWPGTVLWPSGNAPTASGASKTDLIMFYYDGTNYFGSYLLNY